MRWRSLLINLHFQQIESSFFCSLEDTNMKRVIVFFCLTLATQQPTLDGGGVHMPIHCMDVFAMGKLLERVYPEGFPTGLEK